LATNGGTHGRQRRKKRRGRVGKKKEWPGKLTRPGNPVFFRQAAKRAVLTNIQDVKAPRLDHLATGGDFTVPRL